MLDVEQINLLPNNLKQKYMAFEKFLGSPGFKYIVEWAKLRFNEAQQAALTVGSWEQTCFARGAMAAYLGLMTLDEHIEAEFAAIAQQEAESRAKLDDSDDGTDLE